MVCAQKDLFQKKHLRNAAALHELNFIVEFIDQAHLT
jgi:hypothetical protein